MTFTYERYRFNGSFNQSLPQLRYATKEIAEEAKKRDEQFGIKTYEIKEIKD